MKREKNKSLRFLCILLLLRISTINIFFFIRMFDSDDGGFYCSIHFVVCLPFDSLLSPLNSFSRFFCIQKSKNFDNRINVDSTVSRDRSDFFLVHFSIFVYLMPNFRCIWTRTRKSLLNHNILHVVEYWWSKKQRAKPKKKSFLSTQSTKSQ